MKDKLDEFDEILDLAPTQNQTEKIKDIKDIETAMSDVEDNVDLKELDEDEQKEAVDEASESLVSKRWISKPLDSREDLLLKLSKIAKSTKTPKATQVQAIKLISELKGYDKAKHTGLDGTQTVYIVTGCRPKAYRKSSQVISFEDITKDGDNNGLQRQEKEEVVNG